MLPIPELLSPTHYLYPASIRFLSSLESSCCFSTTWGRSYDADLGTPITKGLSHFKFQLLATRGPFERIIIFGINFPRYFLQQFPSRHEHCAPIPCSDYGCRARVAAPDSCMAKRAPFSLLPKADICWSPIILSQFENFTNMNAAKKIIHLMHKDSYCHIKLRKLTCDAKVVDNCEALAAGWKSSYLKKF